MRKNRRTEKRNNGRICAAGAVLPAALAAALAVTAFFARPAYAAGEPQTAQAVVPEKPQGSVSGDAGTGEPEDSLERETAETKAPDRGVQTAAGTTILIGAGVYTYARGKWKEEKDKSKNREPVYFENNTRTGILRSSERGPEP